MLTALAFLFVGWELGAQQKSDREIEIHKNVKLIESTASSEIPGELVTQYQNFLPIFREVLKATTKDQPDQNVLTVRISAGFKEVGAAKTKRAQAQVTAFCRNSKQEYIGNFLLYSYATSSPVNKDETEQFLRKQILEPLECLAPGKVTSQTEKAATE
jgi:hypothetical protein